MSLSLPQTYKPMWMAIAHLLSSDLLSGTLCNVELLVAPLNSLGFGGVNGSAIVDFEMVKAALTKQGEKEYTIPYEHMNIERGGSKFLLARIGIRRGRGKDRVRVSEVGCFSSVEEGMAIKEANNTQSIRGIALLPEDIQNDLISFLIDKPWNKQIQSQRNDK